MLVNVQLKQTYFLYIVPQNELNCNEIISYGTITCNA